MGRMSRSPAGATVSIRFDMPRWFRGIQDHGASAPICRREAAAYRARHAPPSGASLWTGWLFLIS